MASFYFVVPPFAGHVNPTVSVAGELERRGHRVAWVGYREPVSHLLPSGARVFDLRGDISDELFASLVDKARTVRGLVSLKFLWEDVLIPLAHAMAPGVEAAVASERPDVLVVDQQAFAGAMVARKLGVRWATFATTSVNRKTSLESLPAVLAWTEERLSEAQEALGLAPVREPEISPELLVVFSTEALIGDLASFPPQTAFVGPALGHRRAAVDFPWDALRPGPRVLVSLGTLNGPRGKRFYDAVAAGLGDAELQVVMVAPDELGPFPDNFVVRPFVPQLELLGHVQAVVCHGGHNTVCEALAEGLPLVVAPIKDDQPVVAQQVAAAGCGLRLSFGRPRPAAIREAVERVMGEPEFRAAAERIRNTFATAGGAPRAAELLETLAARSASS